MKISISYPPLESEKGVPLLTQNRQFQWFNNPTYIYPVVPAYAATLLKSKGHEVIWDDAISDGLSFSSWWKRLIEHSPEIIVFESKTPVIKLHWRIINKIKNELSFSPILILVGDHVTALPEESFQNSEVDYIITGGDYDFILDELVNYISRNAELPKGIYYKENGKVVSTGAKNLAHDLNSLPLIDRELTKWQNYAYKNGNFKYTPGTYVMAGRDCWWGRCSFCSWTTLYPGNTYRTVSYERHVEEIGKLITDYRVREIFDDSGCFPKGDWLNNFCEQIITRKYNKKITLGCNMRVGALLKEQWKLMKRANFRFILIGLESINQSTLDKLNKKIYVEEIEETVRMAKEAGLEPHITTMVGYPWETKEDAQNTISFAKNLFLKGYIDSLQATIVVPYPGTPMFDEAKKNSWLLTEDWEKYDMRQSVWKSSVTNQDILDFTQSLYRAALSPKFIMRKFVSIRNLDDLKFILRAGSKVFGHLADFRKKS